MDFAERMLFFGGLPARGLLDTEVLVPLVSTSRELSFEAGERLFEQDQPVRRLLFLIEGEVALRCDGVEVGRVRAPGAVGPRALLAQVEMPYGVLVTEPVLALEVDPEPYLELLEDRFSLWLKMLRLTYADLLQQLLRDPSLQRNVRLPLQPFRDPRAPNLVERMLLLRDSLSFGQSSVNALAELAQGFLPQEVPDGEILFRHGDEATELRVVLTGTVEARLPDGSSFSLEPGALVGGVEALAGERRWYTATARAGLSVLSGPVNLFFDVLEDNPALAMRALAEVSRRTLELDVAQRQVGRALLRGQRSDERVPHGANGSKRHP